MRANIDVALELFRKGRHEESNRIIGQVECRLLSLRTRLGFASGETASARESFAALVACRTPVPSAVKDAARARLVYSAQTGSRRARIAAVRAIGRNELDGREEVLARLYETCTAAVRLEVLAAFGKLTCDHVPGFVRRALDEKKAPVRLEAVRTLGHIRCPDGVGLLAKRMNGCGPRPLHPWASSLPGRCWNA